MNTNEIKKAMNLVREEVERQDKQWGPQKHGTVAEIIGKEFGEACRAVLKTNGHNLRKECAHVAASALQVLAWIDRFQSDGDLTWWPPVTISKLRMYIGGGTTDDNRL